MGTGFGFIVIREVECTEEVFPNNGIRYPRPSPSIQISPPQSFNFAQPDELLQWIRCFERFREAWGLNRYSQMAHADQLLMHHEL